MTTYSTIDDLPAGTPAGTDKLEVSQGGVSRRVTFAQVGSGAVLPFLPTAGGTLTGNLNGTTAAFSGEITAATPALADNDTTVATTAFVKGQNYAGAAGFLPIGGGTLTGPLAGTTAAFSGSVTMPTQAPGTNNTTGATTAFVGVANAALAPLASPTFTGDPKAPTPTYPDNDTSVATTAYVTTAIAVVSGGGPFLPTAGGTLSGPLTGTTANFSGLVTALTPTPAGDSSTKLATTAFVQGALPTTLPPNGAAGGVLAGTYPNPSFLRGVLQLSSEVVLGSTATTIDVTFPAGAKRIEVEYNVFNNVAADFTAVIQMMVGGTPVAGTAYAQQTLLAVATSPSSSTVASQAAWSLGSAFRFTGNMLPQPVSTSSWTGTLREYAAQNAGAIIIYEAAINGASSGVTGFRFTSSGGATTLAVGSYVRLYAVF